MPLGISDLRNVSLPTAWDGNELSRLSLRDGTTYEALVRDIDAALQVANEELLSGYLGQLVSLTDEAGLEYRTGVSNGFENSTEYSQPDAKRAEMSGHMLPILDKDRKLGWTAKFLRDARRARIEADIADMIQDAQNAVDQAILTRMFKMEEETGAAYGLGASGYSVPWADGGGGTIAFTPVNVPDRAAAFAASHDHFLRLNGITQANLETAVKALWEHSYDGPFELVVSLADIASWTNTTNVTGYVEKADPLVQYGQDTSLARVGEFYMGGVKTEFGFCRLAPSGRIPTGYWGVTKSYGPGDQRNPLKIRYDDLVGFGTKLVTQNVSKYPLMGAIGELRFGVGVGMDRAGAVVVENDSSGDYATPTIS